MIDVMETGLVKVAAGPLKTEIEKMRDVWIAAREREGERLVIAHIEEKSKPRWFGFVKPIPPTPEQAEIAVRQIYGEGFKYTYRGWTIFKHLQFLDDVALMANTALEPAGDHVVYLSGAQLRNLKAEPSDG